MSLARIKELQKLIKTFWESGEISSQTRMEVGKAIEGIQKGRSAARTMTDIGIEDPLKLLDVSYERAPGPSGAGFPLWGRQQIDPLKTLAAETPVSPYSTETILGLVDKGIIKSQRVDLLGDQPGKDISKLYAELQDVRANKAVYTKLRGQPGVSQDYVETSLTSLRVREESLLSKIYGKAFWEAKKSDTSFEYKGMVPWEGYSGQYVFSGELKKEPWKLPKEAQEVQGKQGIFTKAQTNLKKSVNEELGFIENVLTNPERAAEYEKSIAGPYFYKYWTEKGGITDLKWYRAGLTKAMQAEVGVETPPLYAKYGKIKTIAEAKTHEGPPFASLQGTVAELWKPSSPMIKQVGLVEDVSGERIKFTTWANQPNVPTFEVGDKYYFGNVFLKEFQGKWGFEIKQTSQVEKIGGQMFYVGKSTTPAGTAVDIRDYSKPYSIDPKKGTITYTTKGGKVVEAPVPKAEMGKKAGIGDVPADDIPQYTYGGAYEGSYGILPLPFLAAPFIMQPGANQTQSTARVTAQTATQRMTQEQKEQALRAVMQKHHEEFMSIAHVPVELGGKWLQKGQEAYASLEARQAEYAADPSKQRKFRPFAFFEDLPYLGMGALDILGGALYPLNYPLQAAWGMAGGMSPMEGIRQEITPAQVLGIEDPWQALAADIIGDPLNLLIVGALSKGQKATKLMETLGVSKKGLKTFAADEVGGLGRPTAGYVKRAEAEIHPEDARRVRDIITSQKEAGISQAMAGAPRSSSQDKWLLGGGAALAGAGWAGYELTKKEIDPWAAASTPSLPQVPMHPGYTGRSSKYDPFAAYNIGNITAPSALPTAQTGAAGDDEQSLLWKALDVLSTVSYAEGAAIDYLRTGEWKGIGAKITPSEALGITPEGEDVALWRHALGFALDVGIDPTTYLSFGAGGAVRVVGTGGSKLALSAKGVKELGMMRKTLTPKSAGVMADAKRLAIGEELGTKEFIARIESDPAFRKQVLSSEGMSMRAWFLPGGMEKEILSKQSMDWMLTGPRAVLSAAGETSVGQGLARRFVAFHDIKKLARPANMPVGEAEYVDRYFSYKKKVPYLQKRAIDEAAEMARAAKEVLGDDYQEIMAQLIEAPVTRGASDVPAKAREIAEKIEAEHKLIAEAEKARDILGAEIESMGYLKHMLTPEAREYLKTGKKIPGDISGKWGTQTGSSIQRGHKGTLTEINEEARKTLGFDLFEPDPFTAYATRKVESIKAVETHDYLEYVEKYYGKASVSPGEAAQFDTVGIQQLKGVNLPKPIAEHLREEFVAQKSQYREAYDKLMAAWKYTATVPFPAYHAQNVVGGLGYNAMLLGDTSVLSAARMADILKGGGRQKKYTSALGQELTGEQILQKLGEHGVLGQPGQMDIPLAMKTKLSGTKTIGETAKGVLQMPVQTAMAEEDLIRGTMALDRWLKGDTWEQAADWAIKHQFGYSPERYTAFERAYMLPLVPFYKFQKGNIPLQFEYAAKQPGKQLLLPRATQESAGEDESLDDWVFGYAATNLNAQAMGMMGFREDTLAYFRTPEESLQIAENPFEYTWMQAAPWFKLPVEIATQKRSPGMGALEKDYSDVSWAGGVGGAAPIVNMLGGRPLSTYEYMTGTYDTSTEKMARGITGINTAQLPSAKEADTLFKQQSARPGSTTYEQRKAIWKRDLYKSGSGISGLQLQTGHIVPAEWGGPPEPWNLITQTFEENMEQAAAQKRRQTLPWRIEQEKEFIRKLRLTSAEKLEEAAAKKDDWGRSMNAAQLEKVKYDRRKSDNLSLYQRLINHLNTEISWVEKEIYTEEKALEEKTAKGIKDPVSVAQISAMRKLLTKYTAKRDELVRLKEEEQAKELELPAQVTEGERFRGMNIGRWNEYTVRYGKGPELAKEEDILSLAEDTDELISPLFSLEELTLGREVVQGAPWAVDYRNLSLYPQQGAELMWTATKDYRLLQAAAEPLVKELFSESLGRPSEDVFKLPAKEVRRTSGDVIKEMGERGDVPAEAGTGAGECRATDYEDPEFVMAVQDIVADMLNKGTGTD